MFRKHMIVALPFAVAALLAGSPVLAQDRDTVQDACRDRLKDRGYRSPKLDDVRFDRDPGSVTMTANFRSGKDRFDLECRVGRDGRVRKLSLEPRRRPSDNDHGRPPTSGKPRPFQVVAGADAATLDKEMRAMGYEPVRPGSRDWSYWFQGSIGDCVAVRMAGNKVVDMRQQEARDCR